jgi:hypothetical protein
MSDITLEMTLNGSPKPSKRRYINERDVAMEAWDDLVEFAVGGDKLRLVDNITGRIMSEYNPVQRAVL